MAWPGLSVASKGCPPLSSRGRRTTKLFQQNPGDSLIAFLGQNLTIYNVEILRKKVE